MGQIKNIKLHIVTDIKVTEDNKMGDIEPTGTKISTDEPVHDVAKENKPPGKRQRRDRGPIRTNFAGGQFPARLTKFLPQNTEKDPEFDSIRDPHIPPCLWNAKKVILPLKIQEEEHLRKEIAFKENLLRCEREKLSYQKDMVVKHLEEQAKTSALTADSPRGLIKKLLDRTDDPDDTTFMVHDASTSLSTTS